ncbi:MAG: hypothetical protein EHM90_03485, partial [Chloroflexi bacterium]
MTLLATPRYHGAASLAEPEKGVPPAIRMCPPDRRSRRARPSPRGGSMEIQPITWVIPIAGLTAVLFAVYLARDVLRRDTGTEAMQDVAGTILEGAVAFIRRQYLTILVLAVLGALIIGLVIGVVETQEVADTDIFGIQLGVMTAVAFFVGALCSMASGVIGMYISVKSNVRTAAAARHSLVEA